MIDYEKLKLAHELCSELKITMQTGVTTYSDGTTAIHCHGNLHGTYFSDIDDLIAHLKELTQPKPKYEIGSYVWVIFKDTPVEAIVANCVNGLYELCFDDKSHYIEEKYIQPTRTAVIEAEIEYWTCLKNDEKSTINDDMSKVLTNFVNGLEIKFTCQHESDEKEYFHKEGAFSASTTIYKCKRCGEFYSD
jgi:DNA-directed RNA polymerase subunit M/transcription elongation factor TFIIS